MTTLRTKLLAEDKELRSSYQENTPKRNIALALRALRKQAKLTQQQVAERSGLTQSRVSKMEAPSGPMPTTDSLNKYADVCGSDLCVAFPVKGTQHTQLGSNEPVCAVF
ncbi:MAG: helix-turn-helix transcriptional regulator [Sulfitobacter sp.]